MDATGYLRGLRCNDMYWQAGMMGMADIFEVLIAQGWQCRAGIGLA